MGGSAAFKVVHILRVCVMSLPVGMLLVTLPLVIEINIILNIVLEVTPPCLLPVVSRRDRRELFMIICLEMLVIEFLMRVH